MAHFIVTSENLEEARDACCALDQRAELSVGCETWSITYSGNQRGQMTVWPYQGCAAVMFGSDSEWGTWDADTRTVHLNSGEYVNEDGYRASAEAVEGLPPTPAGFVITNNEAIWAAAVTADVAWAEFQAEMGFADVDVQAADEGVELTDAERIERRRKGFECHPATAALLAEVEARGGAISWDSVDGVCCTRTEAEGEDA